MALGLGSAALHAPEDHDDNDRNDQHSERRSDPFAILNHGVGPVVSWALSAELIVDTLLAVVVVIDAALLTCTEMTFDSGEASQPERH